MGGAASLPDIARALMQGQSIETRNPNAVRPWQHVLEPLSGYMLLVEKMTTDKTLAAAFNFGPEPRDNRTVEDVIQTALKTWAGTYHASTAADAPHEAGLLKLSINKVRTKLGWQPKWDFETAVANTMTWYKETAAGHAPLDISLAQIKAYVTA